MQWDPWIWTPKQTLNYGLEAFYVAMLNVGSQIQATFLTFTHFFKLTKAEIFVGLRSTILEVIIDPSIKEAGFLVRNNVSTLTMEDSFDTDYRNLERG